MGIEILLAIGSYIMDKILPYLWRVLRWIFYKILFRFLLCGTWDLFWDMILPGPGGRRPWLITSVAVVLSLFAILSYWTLLYDWQITLLKGVYVTTKLVKLWGPDTCDWLKWPVKSFWFGFSLIILVSFAILNKIWQSTKGRIEFDKGLKKFTTWVVNAIDEHTEKIYIAATTPLVHIFHDMPEQEQLSSYGGSDNSLFEEEFCTPFRDSLIKCRKKLKEVRFLSYPPDFLREKSPWLPISAGSDFDTYKSSIKRFAEDVVGQFAKGIETEDKKSAKIKEVFRETCTLPFWIAVIRRQSAQKRPAEHTLVLALTDMRDLQKPVGNTINNKEKKEFAKRIADNIMCIRSTDSNTVDFFEGVFRELWNEENLSMDIILGLLNRSRRGHGIEILLREQYNTSIHGNLEAGKPSEILYSVKK